VDGDLWIESLFTSLPGGQVGFLLAVNLFIFVLAFFLDFFEIAFIVIPLLAPVAVKLGIDLTWFGVLIGANLQTSFMHPPFGFALFYLRGVAPPQVRSSDIYWGALPWVGLQLILVAVIIFWPGLVTGWQDRTAPVPLPATLEAPVPGAPAPEDAAASEARCQKERARDERRRIRPFHPAQLNPHRRNAPMSGFNRSCTADISRSSRSSPGRPWDRARGSSPS
jgi:hypothetical protein